MLRPCCWEGAELEEEMGLGMEGEGGFRCFVVPVSTAVFMAVLAVGLRRFSRRARFLRNSSFSLSGEVARVVEEEEEVDRD